MLIYRAPKQHHILWLRQNTPQGVGLKKKKHGNALKCLASAQPLSYCPGRAGFGIGAAGAVNNLLTTSVSRGFGTGPITAKPHGPEPVVAGLFIGVLNNPS
jgi:hypothetical protein